MAHIVLKSDSEGQTIDLIYYCSDICAQKDKDYAGWNGCVEIPKEETQPMLCTTCKTKLN